MLKQARHHIHRRALLWWDSAFVLPVKISRAELSSLNISGQWAFLYAMSGTWVPFWHMLYSSTPGFQGPFGSIPIPTARSGKEHGRSHVRSFCGFTWVNHGSFPLNKLSHMVTSGSEEIRAKWPMEVPRGREWVWQSPPDEMFKKGDFIEFCKLYLLECRFTIIAWMFCIYHL